jgi:hypothetical protein
LDQDIASIKAKISDGAYETAYNARRALTFDEAVAFATAGK